MNNKFMFSFIVTERRWVDSVGRELNQGLSRRSFLESQAVQSTLTSIPAYLLFYFTPISGKKVLGSYWLVILPIISFVLCPASVEKELVKFTCNILMQDHEEGFLPNWLRAVLFRITIELMGTSENLHVFQRTQVKPEIKMIYPIRIFFCCAA
ncbi:hypothetical protein GIB67_028170 [Kingdonia uniflora]|uniref:Uncharacterized protein n=1 Tax=Kingdonia uniflora TaxID=39325 RepID=A0A7J7KZQ0_9MAGN|nr:hypothetical protein GIB67_028170 [Kingdonia uniflora]